MILSLPSSVRERAIHEDRERGDAFRESPTERQLGGGGAAGVDGATRRRSGGLSRGVAEAEAGAADLPARDGATAVAVVVVVVVFVVVSASGGDRSPPPSDPGAARRSPLSDG